MTTDSTQIISVIIDIVSFDKSRHINLPNFSREEYSYFVVVTLTNTQDTTVNLTTMTCSWEESFVFDNDSIYLYNPGCDSNFPTDLEILPHKTVKFFGKLNSWNKKRNNYNPLTFRIGFIDLPFQTYFFENHTAKDKQKNKMKYKIYWSKKTSLCDNLYEYKKEL